MILIIIMIAKVTLISESCVGLLGKQCSGNVNAALDVLVCYAGIVGCIDSFLRGWMP